MCAHGYALNGKENNTERLIIPSKGLGWVPGKWYRQHMFVLPPTHSLSSAHLRFDPERIIRTANPQSPTSSLTLPILGQGMLPSKRWFGLPSDVSEWSMAPRTPQSLSDWGNIWWVRLRYVLLTVTRLCFWKDSSVEIRQGTKVCIVPTVECQRRRKNCLG